MGEFTLKHVVDFDERIGAKKKFVQMENYRHHQKANESSLHTCSIEVFFHSHGQFLRLVKAVSWVIYASFVGEKNITPS
jgi:hypothetical protein